MQHAALPTVNMALTGANIRALRRQHGMTVKELQEVFGFATPQAIYQWQRGAALPTVDNLVVLASDFRVPMEQILVIEQERQRL
ncbi:MAG: helix-turn-helix domain-containing protein [Aristaeellaceae bacterium]